jgi:hypothetical protein
VVREEGGERQDPQKEASVNKIMKKGKLARSGTYDQLNHSQHAVDVARQQGIEIQA